jgi:tetratricopeptide (TPR) repeat protein
MVPRRTHHPLRVLVVVGFVAVATSWAAAADKVPAGYPFAKPPLQVLEDLTKEVGLKADLSDDEWQLLARVWERKAAGRTADLTDAEQVDLFLLASGTTDPAARRKYRAKVDELRDACEQDLEGVESPAARGEKVFRRVRAAFPQGYESHQTKVTTAFDTGAFNCVSVSALLYLVGTHHGLDLRPMRAPGHAYLEWVPGYARRSVVEGTNPDGFQFVDKMGAIDRWLNHDALETYSHGREIDAAALAGAIYYNRGLFAREQTQPDFTTAIRLHLVALALDPTDKDAAAELMRDFGQWAFTLCCQNAEGSERALKLMRVATAAAPANPILRRFQGLVWLRYAAYALDDGDDGEAVHRAKRAGEVLPNDYRFDSPAAMYAWFAFRIASGGDWETGLVVLERGLKAVPSENRKWLLAQRGEFFRQWSAERVATGDLDGSLRVLDRATKVAPFEPAVAAASRHHAKAAAKHPLGELHMKKLRERFPTLAEADTLTTVVVFGG